MPDPTPGEARRVLAELLGWRVHPAMSFHGTPPRPKVINGVEQYDSLPDPAADLNAMAAVEAVLRRRGLLREYVDALVVASGESVYSSPSIDFAATAPAAVRAVAAYRVLADSEPRVRQD